MYIVNVDENEGHLGVLGVSGDGRSCLPFCLLRGADMSDLMRPLELVPLRRAAVVVEQHDVEVVRELHLMNMELFIYCRLMMMGMELCI